MVSNATILNLPTNGRNSYGFASLVPGVRAPRGFTQVSVGMYNEQFVSINGARAYQSNFQMDGGANSNPAFNGPTLFPSVDMVQEYRVQTNNFSAEFTNSAGGVVNLVTKSGTNQWHGSAFEFLRNDKLVGNNYFNNLAGLPRGVFRFNQFGATVGGPVRIPHVYNGTDRTFFFFTYEGLRWVQNVTTNGSVPTLAQRGGDFSQTRNAAGQVITAYDPSSSRPDPDRPGRFIRTPFQGNIIPVSRWDLVARNLIPYIPLPTSSGDRVTGVNNYINNSSAPIRKNLFSGRVDHALNSNQKIFGRLSHNGTFFGRPFVFSKEYTPASITRGDELDPSEQGVVNYTHVISPTLVLELSSSYVEYQLHRHGASIDWDPVQLGFNPILRQIPLRPCFPSITVGGFGFTASVNEINVAGATLIGACGLLRDVYNTFSNSANLSKNRGKHTMKFGGNFAVSNLHTLRNLQAGHSYNFNAGFTQGPDPLVASTAAGVGFASFLLGAGSGGSINTSGPGLSVIFKNYGLYFQNDWKVTPRLTLNLGIRYDFYTPWTERYNQLSNIDFTSPSPLKVAGLELRGGLTFPGVGGLARGQFEPDRNNFAPRFGIAYELTKKTILRGGYGIFTSPTTGDGYNGGIPSTGFVTNTPWVPTIDGVTPAETLTNAYSGGLIFAPGNKQGLATLLGQGITGIDRGKRNAYAQQWNISIQRSLPGNFFLDTAYAGSHGVHLYANLNYNQLPNQYLAMGDAIRQTVPNPFFGLIGTGTLAAPTVARGQLLRPYPQFTGFTAVGSSFGSSLYHSLQIKLERRFHGGFSILGAYTYSKIMDDVTMLTPWPGDVSTPSIQDFNNRRNERAVAVFDAPHNVAISGVWEFPFGKNKRFLKNGRVAQAIAGGWQVNGIATFRSGVPLTFTTATNNLFNFGGTQRASWTEVSPDVPGPIQDRLNRYFNPAAFAQPAPFTYGNSPRVVSSIRGPGINNFDVSLFKNILLREKATLQFRAEAFNVANRVEFGLPNTVIGSPAAGSITSQVNQPRDIQFALKLLF